MKAKSFDLVKEKATFEDAYILKVALKNGVTLYINEKGYGEGTDGTIYYPVLKEVKEKVCGVADKNLKVVGWSNKISREIII